MSITREDVRNLETKPVTTSNVRRRINLLGVGGVGSNVARICYREQHRRNQMFYGIVSMIGDPLP